MGNNAVQVVLDTRSFITIPERDAGGGTKDFFLGRNDEFQQHKASLQQQLAGVTASFVDSGLSSGILKVTLRKDALAKSHRPHRSLFPPQKRPCIGATELGTLFYRVNSEGLGEIQAEISKAEVTSRTRIDSKTGEELPSPTVQRSEVGAIESLTVPSSSDKRRFSVDEAVQWLADERTSGAYLVEVFSPGPDTTVKYSRRVLAETEEGLRSALAQASLSAELFSIELHRLRERVKPTGVFGIRLLVTEGDQIKANINVRDHQRLLDLLEANPEVRRIILPPLIMESQLEPMAYETDQKLVLPKRDTTKAYPKVGVIDGGISSNFGDWIVGQNTSVSTSQRDEKHGTFIAGLLVAGQQLNGAQVCMEPDGCDVYDVAIFPDRNQPSAFRQYYPRGILDFLNEIELSVETAKAEHGVRIFNMSLNLRQPVENESYGVVASLLDHIADQHQVIFVLSAGNLESANVRAEWPKTPENALQALAARTDPDTLLQPCESSRSLAVGAVNPLHCPSTVGGAPCAYTRRGPGLRVGVKPDVAHFGGSAATGMVSISPGGNLTLGTGTSYASPNVAKALATIENRVQNLLPPELLTALLIHSARIPVAISDKSLGPIARQFVGFGVPGSTEEILFTSDSAISLVFSDVLHHRAELVFPFAWPTSLVKPNGSCRGEVKATLVYRPPLDSQFGAEFVRVNMDAHLRQEHNGTFKNRITQGYLPAKSDANYEHELIKHGLKWWPTKVYGKKFKVGVGDSSNWQLVLQSLRRSEAPFPPDGVPFAVILTISDPKGAAPVFSDLRLYLRSRNVNIADIRTSAQVRIR